MTNEAVGEAVDSTLASPELIALVVKREEELRGAKPSAPASEAVKANGSVDDKTSATDAGQAEEVEAGSKKAADDPDKGKSETDQKALDVEWAKSDAMKRRITSLHEAGNLDDELLNLLKDGANAREIRKGSNKKFEEAADKVKAANAERDAFKERAERYDRLMADPKFHKAMQATEEVTEDESFMTPEEKRIAALEKRLADRESLEADSVKGKEARAARIKDIEGWAEDHRSSLGDGVSAEDYEAALKVVLTTMLEEDEDPLQSLTQRGLARKVNRVLERQRDDQEVQGLRERVDGSKRDAVRSTRASSPAGVRTEVGKTYASPREKRIAETLAKYPLRPE